MKISGFFAGWNVIWWWWWVLSCTIILTQQFRDFATEWNISKSPQFELRMQLFFLSKAKSGQVDMRRISLRLKGLFDELDCLADKPHNGHLGRWEAVAALQLSLPSQENHQQCLTKWFFHVQTGDRTPMKGWRNLSKFRSLSWSFWRLPMFYRQRRFIGDLLSSCCCFLEWKICPFKWKTEGKN